MLQAENGVELFEIVQRTGRELDGHISLIITDVRMPKLDGIAAVRALRMSGTTIPVIFMSAFGDSRTRDEATKADTWIDKPIGLNDLRAAVADVLRDQVATGRKSS